MTVKLVVLYTQPDDPAAFDAHYVNVHVPLVRKIPGLERFETGTFTAALDGGESTYHRIAELYFRDQVAMDDAFGSPAGAATAEDYGKIAPLGSRMFIQAVDE
ncbi:MAG TPA: EthD family reductase [Streptosporangiaceae bacterium]|nr:EthD family reductase [Streptosporangiaceae bacterium]